MSERVDLNYNWLFTESFDDLCAAGAFPDSALRVDLPHTCRITPYDYFDESIYQILCGYAKTLRIPEAWRGKRVFLNVDGAAHGAVVYLNGRELCRHNCGYTAFKCELTEYIVPGEEARIVISVDSRETQDIPPFGFVIDYMTYGGLTREVWLEVTESAYFSDVFVMPDDKGNAACTVRINGEHEGFCVRRCIFKAGEEDKPLASDELSLASLVPEDVDDDDEYTLPKLNVKNAALWSPDEPNLYYQRTELVNNGEVIDAKTTRFGFRTAVFRADGFYLNGKKVKLRGLNRHQSWPYIGYAAPASLQRFDAEFLKNELGCNAVRTSHYPQSHHFIDRCDELGLMVFTEIPGWQHIGGEAWQNQAVQNTVEMVEQYRNHPSIILWGVRINESVDNDALYSRTNAAAHELDPTRQTGGVRCYKKGSFLEDVYTYNDFVHEGNNLGCEPKKKVTPDMNRAYLVSEYNGHMFPTKAFDSEEHLLQHALRHANVLDAAAGQSDIAGSFGWCMADYNTHRDFGSGDRICYHGVADMFRNQKPAAAVYASQQDKTPVLEVASSMDIGEHPAANRGRLFAFTNADSVRMYKNGMLINEFTPSASPYKHLAHPPVEIDDFIGDQIERNEGFKKTQARYVKDLINYSTRFGFSHLRPKELLKGGWLMLRYRMSFADAYALYGKYSNNWGGEATTFTFEAVKDGRPVLKTVKAPVSEIHLSAEASLNALCEGATYDMALVRITMRDQNDNVLRFYNEAVELKTVGPIELVGPKNAMLRGGMGGALVRTRGAGSAALILKAENAEEVRIEFEIVSEVNG